jgi:outer membrane protein TolC
MRWKDLWRKTAVVLAAVTLAAGAARAHADETLTLADAIARALKFAPSLAAQAAASDIAAANVGAARAPLLPNISAGGEYLQEPGYDPVVTNRGQTDLLLSLNYTAFDGGQQLARLRAARYAAEAATLGVAAMRAQIVFDARVAYFDLARARAERAELSDSLARLDRYVAIVEALRRSGRAIPNDVLRIRAARDATAIQRAGAVQQVHHASIVLGSLIGEFDRDDLPIAPVTAPPRHAPSGDPDANPAYRAAERQVESAQMALEAARRERMPTFTIALTSGYLGIDPPNTFQHRLGASYGGGFNLPIFSGGLIKSHIDAAGAAERQAIARREAVKVAVMRALSDARERYEDARKQLALIQSSEATADDAFGLDWTRFLGGGAATMLEVVDAFDQAQALRIAAIEQIFAARQAAAQAALALGQAQ